MRGGESGKALRKTAKELYEEARKKYPNAWVPTELHMWRYPDVIDVETLAKLLDLPDYDELHERNADFIWETARERVDLDPEDPAFDDVMMDEQHDVEDEYVFGPWHRGVIAAAFRAFDDHLMGIQEVGRPPKGFPKNRTWRPWQYRIRPDKSWRDTARRLVKTIDGVGVFGYSGAQGLIDSGPYTPQSAVISHLHWMRRWPEITGDTLYERTYELAFQ